MTGALHWPSVRQCMLPISETIWLNASGRKSANCRNATGRWPANARPTAVPTIVDSDNGAFMTRCGCSVLSPFVTPNTSPLGSSMSSPNNTTRLSVLQMVSQYLAQRIAHRQRAFAKVSAAFLRRMSQFDRQGPLGGEHGGGFGTGGGLGFRRGHSLLDLLVESTPAWPASTPRSTRYCSNRAIGSPYWQARRISSVSR